MGVHWGSQSIIWERGSLGSSIVTPLATGRPLLYTAIQGRIQDGSRGEPKLLTGHFYLNYW